MACGRARRRMTLGASESGVGRITHEIQILQTGQAAEGASRDARELVVLLLRDEEDERRSLGWRVAGRDGE